MKKTQLLSLILLTILVLIVPNKVSAKEEKLICKYQYQNKDLIYIIQDQTVEVPFTDGDNNWYHGQVFEDSYLKASKSNYNYICPTITIEESDLFTTIFSMPITQEDCNGQCLTISANNTTKKAVDTTAIGSVGIYNDDKYFVPYFRVLADDKIEWSIDGKTYISTNQLVTIKTSNNKKATIKLEKKLVDEIFKNGNLNPNVTIYRNVKQSGNDFEYLLSTEKNNNYNLNDGQETKSNSYNGSFGDKGTMEEWMEDYEQQNGCTDDNSILGNYNDDRSVAWLLKEIFGWIKLIAPFIVVVMSGIDFAKVIVLGDDELMKKAQKKLIIRLILAVSLFFLPDLIAAILELFNITSSATCGL